MAELHEDLKYSLENDGPVRQIRSASAEEVSRLREILPKPLADFIELKGYYSFYGGLFTMCNPDELRPILALAFGADEQFHHQKCHAIGYSAFGELAVWSDEWWNFDVSLTYGEIYASKMTDLDWESNISAADASTGFLLTKGSMDYSDYTGDDMFDRCVEMHGPLEPGECYGFFPALAMVGRESPFRRVENIRRVKALEHFAMIAQMQPFHLMKLVPGGVAPVRMIG